MFFLPLYGFQYFSHYNVYCAMTLSQKYELMQCLEVLHELPLFACRLFHRVLYWHEVTLFLNFLTTIWEKISVFHLNP